jgi:uncharacterized repeat protein (TIGR01451 family)
MCQPASSRSIQWVTILAFSVGALFSLITLAAASPQSERHTPASPRFEGSSASIAHSLFAPGDAITYTVLISNSGPDKVFDASMLDSLPAGLTLNPASLTASYGTLTHTQSVVSWTGSLLPGAGAFVTIPVSVNTCEWPLTNSFTLSEARESSPTVISAYPQEGFEGLTLTGTQIFPPLGWGFDMVTGTTAMWSRVNQGIHPSISPEYGLSMAEFNAYSATNGAAARLNTRLLNLPANYDAWLSFRMYHDTDVLPSANSNNDRVQVQISINGGLSYQDVVSGSVPRYNGTTGWSTHTFNLHDYAGMHNIRIGLLGISDFGNNIYIDQIAIQYRPQAGDFSYQPVSPLAGEVITFTGYTMGASNLYSKTWDFDNTATVLSGNQVTQTFNSGIHWVRMRVCGFEVTRPVTVSATPVSIQLDLQASQPLRNYNSASFTATLHSGSLPISYTWDFGDGAMITGGLLTSHTYITPGSYTVTLSATNAAGAFVTHTQQIVIPVADVRVQQSADPMPVRIGQNLTYRLLVSNNGPDPVNSVWVTDTLPNSASMTITAWQPAQSCQILQGGLNCTLAMINVSHTEVITLTVIPRTPTIDVNHVEVGINAFDPAPGNNQSDLDTVVNKAQVYLPLTLNHYPPIPDTPLLNRVSNPNSNGSYQVSWAASFLAFTYTLQEATQPSFANAVVVYRGPATTWNALNKPAGSYYYRVQAHHGDYESGWSNPQLTQFTLGFDGQWAGATSQNRTLNFSVWQNQVTTLNVFYDVAGCQNLQQPYFAAPVIISGNSFTITQSGATYSYVLAGTFISPTSATGTFTRLTFDGVCNGMTTATWTAIKTSAAIAQPPQGLRRWHQH